MLYQQKKGKKYSKLVTGLLIGTVVGSVVGVGMKTKRGRRLFHQMKKSNVVVKSLRVMKAILWGRR